VFRQPIEQQRCERPDTRSGDALMKTHSGERPADPALRLYAKGQIAELTGGSAGSVKFKETERGLGSEVFA
jgi:hypothetical protein